MNEIAVTPPSLYTQAMRVFFSLMSLLWCAAIMAAPSERVQLLRTPDGGIQPQAVVDENEVIHLIYFKGEAKGGNVFYRTKGPRDEQFSNPIQVNSASNSAVVIGTVRGAQLAIGKNGRAHVAWNGSGTTPGGQHQGAPLWYARLNEAGNGFEKQRDLITRAGGLDGGCTIAAEQENVYALWHGELPDNLRGEAGRAVYIARSIDAGKTFTPEEAATSGRGACACCGMRAFADRSGNLFALYRAAAESTQRDEILLLSRDHGKTFAIAHEHPWQIAMCPMSTAAISGSKTASVAAWETAGQIYFSIINAKDCAISKSIAASGSEKCKNPAAAINAKGEIMVTWTHGTGWAKGGSVAWQLFDPTGHPTALKGRSTGVAVWGLVSCMAKPDGNFIIFY
ncbi:MAG: hypothetical protein ABIR24_10325 [Verrucomicrobiota bacterium]